MPVTLSIDQCFKRLQFRSDKAGYNSVISPEDFNFLWPSAEITHFSRLFEKYPSDRRASTSLSVFSKVVSITIDVNGQYVRPNDYIYTDSAWAGTKEITRVEKDRIANNLDSTYDAPDNDNPIYTEYNTYLQFYPITLGSATLNYLSFTPSSWGYVLAGSIITLNTGSLTGGSGYVNGTYTGVPLSGGIGTGAVATIVVSGGAVTSVTITNTGVGYLIGDILGAANTFLGGTGGGFTIPVFTISVQQRPVYSAINSVEPLWSVVDIDEIISLILRDIGINSGDEETIQFANQNLGIEQQQQ